ncbi:MAG: phosphatidylserine/phosphatidylglycerophosphate/cardiolipin synthase family protein [Gemmatimonadaceae bacterium]
MPNDDPNEILPDIVRPPVLASARPEGAAPVRIPTPRALVRESFEGPRPSFSRALWRIANARVSAGNTVALLRDGPQAFEAMLAMIEGARQSVEFEGYIFHNDDVGARFADAFRAAARRGVKVRMLVDWFGRLPTPKRFFELIHQEGVGMRFFNPLGFRAWGGLLPRDHRKVLVVDEYAGVTGGIGIGQEWGYGIIRRRRHSVWRDTAVRIEGDAVLYMREAFERMWARARGRTPEWRRLRTPPAAVETHLSGRFDPPALVGIVEGEPGRWRVSRALQLQAVAAERSIWIASAYFMPSWSELEALAGAARDGVDVRVLVPSTYDHPFLRRLATRFYHRLLRNGVRLWEWRGEMMHAKTTVIDGRWVRVGSTDFNPLGVAINYELDALIEDRTLGEQAERMFLEDLEHSREIGQLRPPRDGTSLAPTPQA